EAPSRCWDSDTMAPPVQGAGHVLPSMRTFSAIHGQLVQLLRYGWRPGFSNPLAREPSVGNPLGRARRRKDGGELGRGSPWRSAPAMTLIEAVAGHTARLLPNQDVQASGRERQGSTRGVKSHRQRRGGGSFPPHACGRRDLSAEFRAGPLGFGGWEDF